MWVDVDVVGLLSDRVIGHRFEIRQDQVGEEDQLTA